MLRQQPLLQCCFLSSRCQRKRIHFTHIIAKLKLPECLCFFCCWAEQEPLQQRFCYICEWQRCKIGKRNLRQNPFCKCQTNSLLLFCEGCICLVNCSHRLTNRNCLAIFLDCIAHRCPMRCSTHTLIDIIIKANDFFKGVSGSKYHVSTFLFRLSIQPEIIAFQVEQWFSCFLLQQRHQAILHRAIPAAVYNAYPDISQQACLLQINHSSSFGCL